jgi:NADPH:quinone reductase-like Zn-dependent oxidoreductase
VWRHGGAFAEYAAVPEARFERKPADLTFAQAAAVPTSGSLAVQVLATRDGSKLDRRS